MFTISSKIYLFAMLSTTLSLINAMEETDLQTNRDIILRFKDSTACVSFSVDNKSSFVYEQQPSAKFKPYLICQEPILQINKNKISTNLSCFELLKNLDMIPVKMVLESSHNTYHGFLQIGYLMNNTDLAAIIIPNNKFKPVITNHYKEEQAFNKDFCVIIPAKIQFICSNSNHLITDYIKDQLDNCILHPQGSWQTKEEICQAVEQKIVTISRQQINIFLKLTNYQRQGSHEELFHAGEVNPLNQTIKKQLKKTGFSSVHTMIKMRQYRIR